MKDTKSAVRKAFYTLLNGQLSYNGSDVPVSADRSIIYGTSDFYVLLGNQDETDDSTKNDFTSTSTITIDIIHKTKSAVSRQGINEVAGQLFNLVLPTKVTTGLIPPANWQFHNIQKESDIDLDVALNATSVGARRIITFRLTVIQN